MNSLLVLHLSLAADWWWSMDFSTGVVTVSPSVQRYLGYTPDELTTFESIQSIVHPSDVDACKNSSESAQRTGRPTTVRLRYRTKSGGTRTMSVRTQIVLDGSGTPVGLAGVCREIDDMLAVEKEVVQRNEDLAQVASILSHDFRGPARHIFGITQKISDEVKRLRSTTESGGSLTSSDFDDAARWCELDMRAADRLGKMIEHVLQYSRAGTKGIQPEDIDVADVVSDILRDYAERIAEHHTVVRVKSLPVVHYDRTMLYLVLANLVSNAIKFSKKDDPAPVIEIGGRATSMEMVSIAVVDHGIGIPASQTEKILDMGFRLHHESDYAGFGYGLAIVRKILRRCGGELGIRSRVDEGSEFVVTLPAGRMLRV